MLVSVAWEIYHSEVRGELGMRSHREEGKGVE
jgi:hypothetical protein